VTPGPVFTTATFLGYLLGGVPGALVATAAIFVPSFVMVSVVAPHVHRLRTSAWATAALQGVTAAALGLIAGVTIDLVRTGVDDVLRAAVAIAALVAIVRWRPNPALLVAAGGLIGIAHALA
jgi:chromate transporter